MADAPYSTDADVQDGASWAAGTGIADIGGGVFNDSIANVGSGNAGGVRITASRAFHVNPRDAVGGVLFPTAAALADATSNPTVSGIGAYMMGWNGATWDRMKNGVQYVENNALGATGQGTLVLGRAAAAAPSSVSADADAVGLWASRFGALNVILRDTTGTYVSGGSGVSIVDAAAWTTAVSVMVPAGGVFNDSATALSSGTQGTARLTAQRAQHVTLRNIANTAMFPDSAALADATSNPTLTGIAAYMMGFNGTTWDRMKNGVQYVEATALGSTPTGTQVMARRTDTLGTLTPTVDQAASIRVNSRGALWMTPDPTTMVPITSLDAAPNVDTGVLAVGVGPGWDRKQNPANLGTVVNNAITIVNDGADFVTFAIGTSTTGTAIIEVTADDSTWVAATTFDYITSSGYSGSGIAFTPASGTVIIARTQGYRQVRIRTATTLGATVAVKWTAHLGPIFHSITGYASTNQPSAAPIGTLMSPWFDTHGLQMVGLADQAGNKIAALTGGDGNNLQTTQMLPTTSMMVASRTATAFDMVRTVEIGDGASQRGILASGAMFWNGATYDRAATSQGLTYLTSAARTTTQTQGDQTNTGRWRGILVYTNVTSAGTGSITVTVDWKDPVTGNYIHLNTGTAIIANGSQTITIYPGQTAAGALTNSITLPRTFRILVTANNANSVTYSVGYVLLA